MADSDALRARRSRAHRAGDHSLCSRCAAVKGGSPAQPGRDLPPGETCIPAGDKARLRWLATTLAGAYRDDPGNALLARELRMTLQALMGDGKGGAVDDELEHLFAELGAA